MHSPTYKLSHVRQGGSAHMVIIEWLLREPLFAFPVLCFLAGFIMVSWAPISYQLRTGKLFKLLISLDTIITEYTAREKKLLFFGVGLGILGIMGVFVVQYVYRNF